jgi:hypothetical protein
MSINAKRIAGTGPEKVDTVQIDLRCMSERDGCAKCD